MQIMPVSICTKDNSYKNNYQRSKNISFRAADKVVTKGLKHIKNSTFDTLNLYLRGEVDSINRSYEQVKEFFNHNKNFLKVSELRKNYENLEIIPMRRGYTFKYPQDDMGNLITIYKRRSETENLLFLTLEGNGKTPYTFIINDNDKILANVSQNRPTLLPINFRYMTKEQIEASNIEKYIGIADKEMSKYSWYLSSSKGSRLSSNKSESVKITTPVKAAKKISAEPTLENLLGLFSKQVSELPKHINAQISPATKKPVIISINLENGEIIKASKRFDPKYNGDFRYFVIERISKDKPKQSIALDLDTKAFLKCDQQTGKPHIVDDVVYEYSPSELEEKNITRDFNNYLKEFFNEPHNDSVQQEVSVLKIKQKNAKAKLKIEDVDISEIENKKLNKELEAKFKKEQEQADLDFERSSEYKDKPLKDDEFEDFVENLSKDEEKVVEDVNLKNVEQSPNDEYKIEDVDILEIENKKLNKELDSKLKKEQADLDFERSSEYKDKLLKESEFEDVSKIENNTVKEVEPKTGKQTPNDEYKIEDIVPEKIKIELKQKVKEEADSLAKEYFEEFINQFKKSFSEKMNNIKSKLDGLFK